jgi:hypothetical protein
MNLTSYEALEEHINGKKPCLECREALYNIQKPQAMCEKGRRILRECIRSEKYK